MQLTFTAIQENKPGNKWQKLFNTHWSAYKNWFASKGAFEKTDLQTSQKALKKYMPQFYKTYEKLCELAGNSTDAKRFLTGYNPPAYISGCSQLVLQKNPQLIRNYDYHPNLSEGTMLMSQWHQQKVIATGDCLWGAVDGMNDSGICVSLTFGGRKAVGDGFGIPFILRYVLEFATTPAEAVEMLENIPSHMAYNVAVMNKNGEHKTIQLAPDRKPKVSDSPLATNHQGAIDWPEHAAFSKTLEREEYLKNILMDSSTNQETIVKAFLAPPLYSMRYTEGFGTVFTAIYRPQENYVELKWPNNSIQQTFENFKEQQITITFNTSKTPYYTAETRPDDIPVSDNEWKSYVESYGNSSSIDTFSIIIENMKYVPGFDKAKLDKMLEKAKSTEKKRGEIPWEILADLWSEFGKGF